MQYANFLKDTNDYVSQTYHIQRGWNIKNSTQKIEGMGTTKKLRIRVWDCKQAEDSDKKKTFLKNPAL